MTEKTNDVEVLKAAFKAQRMNVELRLEGMKAGMKDPDDAITLCDKSELAVSDDFSTVSGAAAAVAGLKAQKPYLFGLAEPPAKVIPPPPTKAPASPKSRPSSGAFDDSLHPQDRIAQGLEKTK
jgi:hypothetical protein